MKFRIHFEKFVKQRTPLLGGKPGQFVENVGDAHRAKLRRETSIVVLHLVYCITAIPRFRDAWAIEFGNQKCDAAPAFHSRASLRKLAMMVLEFSGVPAISM